MSTQKQKSFCVNAIICAISDTTTWLRRIRLKHESLKKIDLLKPGAHLKIYIPKKKNDKAVLPDLTTGRPLWLDERTKPWVRTYTIRSFNKLDGVLDIEFVLHGDNSPASSFAKNASVGEHLGVGIRSSIKPQHSSNWCLLAGDETAIPAIAAMLEAAPSDAQGIALLEIPKGGQAFTIYSNSKIDVTWLIRRSTPEQSNLLLDEIKKLNIPTDISTSRYVWIAGEDKIVKNVREYFREHTDLKREEVHATVYWKSGMTEDEHIKSVGN